MNIKYKVLLIIIIRGCIIFIRGHGDESMEFGNYATVRRNKCSFTTLQKKMSLC